jgi:hypothetical protein
MNEDIELVKFIKGRLECDVPGDPPHFDEILRAASASQFAVAATRRSRMRIWGASLAAACVAVACSFAVFRLQTSLPTPEATVASVIDLLRAADGSEPTEDESSVAEMLLAWQDAPYESAISGLLAENDSL